jgi:hypothetical protein
MNGIIFYMIIAIFVIKAVKKSKENAKKTTVQPNQPRQQVQPNQSRQQVQPNQSRQQVQPNRPAQRQTQPNQSKAYDAGRAAKQRELKQRLQKQYENVVNKYLTPVTEDGKQQDDIMGRVHANVAEYAGNQIEQEGKLDTIPVTEGHIDNCITDDDCSLMERVNDLMIMGYQANLTFERDFVAEGIEMLNSYEQY